MVSTAVASAKVGVAKMAIARVAEFQAVSLNCLSRNGRSFGSKVGPDSSGGASKHKHKSPRQPVTSALSSTHAQLEIRRPSPSTSSAPSSTACPASKAPSAFDFSSISHELATAAILEPPCAFPPSRPRLADTMSVDAGRKAISGPTGLDTAYEPSFLRRRPR